MRFTVIDPSDDNSYTMLDYSSCFLCEDKGEDRFSLQLVAMRTRTFILLVSTRIPVITALTLF